MSGVRLERITKLYPEGGGIRDFSCAIREGELFAFLGPSGCGKTTLLRCIVGLEAPDTGEIEIRGEVVLSIEKDIFVPTENRGLGMVFQTYAIWPHMNVFNNVAYPLQSRKTPAHEIRDRVAKVLQFVQLEGFDYCRYEFHFFLRIRMAYR